MSQIWKLCAILSLSVSLIGCRALMNAKPIPGVPQPEDRINQIRELGASASTISPEEQAEYAETLAMLVHEETDAIMRREAVMAISHFNAPITEETLRFASKDVDRDVREAACLGWKNYGGESALHEIMQILATDSDIDIRLLAIEILGDFHDERAIAALEAPLSESDAALQHFTILSLQKITGLPTTDRQEWLAYCRERQPKEQVAQQDAPQAAAPSPYLDISRESLTPQPAADTVIPEFKDK